MNRGENNKKNLPVEPVLAAPVPVLAAPVPVLAAPKSAAAFVASSYPAPPAPTTPSPLAALVKLGFCYEPAWCGPPWPSS